MEKVQHRRLTSSQTCQEVTDDCEERAQGPDRSQVRSQEKRRMESPPVMTLPPSPLETSSGSDSLYQEISLSVRWWKWR